MIPLTFISSEPIYIPTDCENPQEKEIKNGIVNNCFISKCFKLKFIPVVVLSFLFPALILSEM